MFLRASTRKKDGKTHRYYSIVENKRVGDGRVLQRHVLYLGEINASQEREWSRAIEVFDEGTQRTQSLSLFAAEVAATPGGQSVQKIRTGSGRYQAGIPISFQ